MRIHQWLLLGLLAVTACQAPGADQIDQAEAIEIARQHISFEPVSIEAEKDAEDGRPVWRVTFRGQPGPHPMGPFMLVMVDRRTGEVVGLAMP